MPKYGIHFIVLQETIQKLQNSSNRQDKSKGRILKDNPYYANMGAIGPDLFFYLRDYDIMKLIQEQLQPYIRIYEDYLKDTAEALEKIGDNIENAVPAIELIARASELSENFEHAVYLQFDKLVTKTLTNPDDRFSAEGNALRGLFQKLFEPPLNVGYEEQDWYWFDMLHYRNVGVFAYNLLKNASADAELQAYAYAYLSHIATDVTGHPYVNEICRGPYRISAQRHVVAENFMDQWKWNRYFADEEKSKNIRVSLFEKIGFEDQPEMPQKLQYLLLKTLKETYSNSIHPLRLISEQDLKDESDFEKLKTKGFPTPKEINEAYISMRLVLEKMGGNEDLTPKEPFEGADEALMELLNALRELNNFDPPPEANFSTSGTCSATQIFNEYDNGCARSFFEHMEDWIESIGELIRWGQDQIRKAAKIALDIIAASALLGKELSEIPVRLLIYFIQKVNYFLYLNINQILSLQGIMYPEPEIANSDVLFIKQLINPFHTKEEIKKTVKKEKGRRCDKYPSMRQRDQSHLVIPYGIDKKLKENLPNDFKDDCVFRDQFKVNELLKDKILECAEMPHTIASFYKFNSNSTPDLFINESPFDESVLKQYTKAKNPYETRKIYNAAKKGFGNSIDFTFYLVSNSFITIANDKEKYNTVYCNWNLDGDRGYGYKEWEGIIPLCEPGDMVLALSPLGQVPSPEEDQFFQQYPKITQDANGFYEGTANDGSDYSIENNPQKAFLACLNVSESSVPLNFSSCTEENDIFWERLLPDRLRINNGTLFRDNIYFINGITTRPVAGIRANYMLLKTLQDSFGQDSEFSVKFLYNRSEGNILGDLMNDTVIDYLYSWGYFYQSLGEEIYVPRIPVRNQSTLSIIALLHHAFRSDKKLIICGHSQGAIQSGNAVLAFAALSDAKKQFLKNNVRLLHMEPEIIPGIRSHLSNLLNIYLQYVDLDDILMTLFSGIDYINTSRTNRSQFNVDVIKVINLINELEEWKKNTVIGEVGLLANTLGFTQISSKLLEILTTQGFPNLAINLLNFYTSNIMGVIPEPCRNAGIVGAIPILNYIENNLNSIFNVSLRKHFMPNQLLSISTHIRTNQLHNDVNVRNFFLD